MASSSHSSGIDAALIAAAEVISGRGIFGLVWCDTDLVVTSRYGHLADFVVTGEPVADTLLPLLGLEDDIKAVREAPGRVFEMPAVRIWLPDAPRARLNLSIMWAAQSQCYLLLIGRTASASEAELLLAQQIRERLILEADARAIALKLERANRDLEEFASIISHDLKAPMRAMRYLTEDAQTAIAGGDIQTAGDKIGRVREQSDRLSAMLTALFDYSRAGYKQDVAARVDLRVLVETIVRSLPQRADLDITIGGEWPVIDTLAAPLDLVVRNLIDNAIKHHDRDNIHIAIIATAKPELVEISVGDDGPGIEPRHHRAIFLPFRRLSAVDDPNSSGMGLALVQRTVEAVGGRLEVVSDPAVRRGTTFKVLWPSTIVG